ncbi:hypothetical protein [Collimonas fungivorans]|uniref:hypothetical protein n=1 Tax=Collimonas fungivorans TaxID=158899 RepID=UPI003FA37ED7
MPNAELPVWLNTAGDAFEAAYPQRIAAATKLSIRVHLAWMAKYVWVEQILSVGG